jgi:hypothetical protein
MVPMEIDGNDSGGFLSNIIKDGKIVIFDPLHSQVDDLGGNTMALEKVGQSEESHWKEVDPDKLTNGPIVIFQLGDVEEKTIHSFHRGNYKMS